MNTLKFIKSIAVIAIIVLTSCKAKTTKSKTTGVLDKTNFLFQSKVKELADKTIKECEGFGSPCKYYIEFYDLDKNGVNEAFVYYTGTYYCGSSGCTMSLYSNLNGDPTFIKDFITTKIPVFIDKLENKIYTRESGGGGTLSLTVYEFDKNFKFAEIEIMHEESYWNYLQHQKNQINGKRDTIQKFDGKEHVIWSRLEKTENLDVLFEKAYEEIYKKKYK